MDPGSTVRPCGLNSLHEELHQLRELRPVCPTHVLGHREHDAAVAVKGQELVRVRQFGQHRPRLDHLAPIVRPILALGMAYVLVFVGHSGVLVLGLPIALLIGVMSGDWTWLLAWGLFPVVARIAKN